MPYSNIGLTLLNTKKQKATGGNLIYLSINRTLLHTREALGMGKKIFERLYSSVKADELIAYKVVAPASLASAHIYLIHKDVNTNYWKQETWLPFLKEHHARKMNFQKTSKIC